MPSKKKLTKDELEEIAEGFRKDHGILKEQQHHASNDHFLVEMLKVLAEDGKLLADDKNQAFSQLNMGGKLKELFATVDETLTFAQAYNYAMHPLDDIQNDLIEMNIFEKEASPAFKVDILQNFIDEWMRKRVPANRLRVNEFIRLKSHVKDFMKDNTVQQNASPKEPEKRRIF